MAVWEARKCCPQVVLVVGDNRKYTYTSGRIIDMFRNYTPLVEVFSIDEAFLDVTHSLSLFDSPEQLPLFPDDLKKYRIAAAMDAVNNRFGDFTVTFATLLSTEGKGSHVISPAWRPDGIRCVDVQ